MLSEEEKKAIEWLNKYIKNIKHEWQECDDSKAVRTVLNLITKLQKENEDKDKQIDLMAEYISKRDVEEDICMKNKTNPDWCNEDYTNCQDCIKKYFADLVEKE